MPEASQSDQPLKLQIQIEDGGKFGPAGAEKDTVRVSPKLTLVERELSNPRVVMDELLGFRAAVRKAVEETGQFSSEAEHLKGKIYGCILRDAVDALVSEAKAAGKRAHLELRAKEPQFRDIPWEALGPEGGQSLGQRPDLTVVRIPISPDGKPQSKLIRTINKRLRILLIAANPDEAEKVSGALAKLCDIGWVELCKPIVGDVVNTRHLEDALAQRRDEINNEVNVIHYVGHGAITELLGADGEALPANWLANVLQDRAKDSDTLRLIYLQSCEGGRSGDYWSTAEVLSARCGVATIAYLFRMDNARARDHASSF